MRNLLAKARICALALQSKGSEASRPQVGPLALLHAPKSNYEHVRAHLLAASKHFCSALLLPSGRQASQPAGGTCLSFIARRADLIPERRNHRGRPNQLAAREEEQEHDDDDTWARRPAGPTNQNTRPVDWALFCPPALSLTGGAQVRGKARGSRARRGRGQELAIKGAPSWRLAGRPAGRRQMSAQH